MAERGWIWSLLAYGALVAIAAARRAPPERALAAGGRGTAREPYPTTRPAPARPSEIPSALTPTRQSDPEKRPREQFENDQPIFAQLGRAKEKGRGRRATAPWQIPWRGWNDIFWRVYASFGDNRLLAVAAGVVFYSLLAIFPAVAAFVSLYGLIADASTIDAHLSLASGIFPAGAVEHSARADRQGRGKRGGQAQLRIHNRPCRGPVERQRRNEGHHRRAQRRL